ncbi:hypothetical protein B0H21DRAFT_687827 [Amylocystis lapponica]|nr:hypothetical protein B0H21DRAFT_687827 [Amylocystis lapponica]
MAGADLLPTSTCRLSSETLGRICIYLLNYGKTGIATLPAFARSCQVFRNPALDVLWHSLPTLAPLIMVMPSDLWIMDTTSKFGRKRHITFSRPLVPNDFIRFLVYAPRIQSLNHGRQLLHLNTYAISPSILQRLNSYRPLPTLLPNLQSLRWSWSVTETDLPCLKVLSGPKLRDFDLSVYGSVQPDAFDNVLKPLTISSPRLAYFSIYTLEHLRAPLMDILRCFHHLTSFKCNTSLTTQALSHLSSLSSLQSLDAKLGTFSESDEEVQSFLNHLDSERFPALRILHLIVDALPTMGTILQVFRPPLLASVSVSCEGVTPAASLEEYFTSVARFCSHKLLRVVQVTISDPPRNDPQYGPRDETFVPLLLFCKLRVLKVGITCPFYITDDLMEDMATSWPHLTRLELGTTCPARDEPPLLTLRGLIPLVQRCPKLSEISLTVDTSLAGSNYYEDQRPGDGATNSLVQSIHLGASKVIDPMSVATFLSDLFPDLLWVNTSWPVPDDEDEQEGEEQYGPYQRWAEVEQFVVDFATVRRQERNWAESSTSQSQAT